MQIFWTENLSVGIDAIDADHRELIAFYNDFSRAVSERAEAAVVIDQLSFLCRYCIAHFGREEDFMRRIGFDGVQNHIAAHDALQDRFLMLYQTYAATLDLTDAEAIVAFLGGWLTNHIMHEDTCIGAFHAGAAPEVTIRPGR